MSKQFLSIVVYKLYGYVPQLLGMPNMNGELGVGPIWQYLLGAVL